jgi:uncharacterized protein YegL
MRRLPVYLLVDVSTSMRGEPIEAVEKGLRLLVAALRKDPRALETAYLSVITFGSSARQIVPLSDIQQFQLPEITARGETNLGGALETLCECRMREVIKTTANRRGDWLPMVFLLTDGRPWSRTANAKVATKSGVDKFHSLKWGMTVSCAAGPRADSELLNDITPECVVELASADEKNLSAFFTWVTASIVATSQSINATGLQIATLDQLPCRPAEVKRVGVE